MNDENTIDLSQLLYVLSKRKSIIITITLVAVIISGILSFFIMSPVYQSQVTAIVGKKNDANSNIQYNDVMMYQNLTKTYSTIATSKLVEGKAAEKLGNGITADKLDKLVSVTPETGTQILDITAQGGTPEEALNRVTAISNAFIETAPTVYNAGEVKIMDKGELPTKTVKPSVG